MVVLDEHAVFQAQAVIACAAELRGVLLERAQARVVLRVSISTARVPDMRSTYCAVSVATPLRCWRKSARYAPPQASRGPDLPLAPSRSRL